MTRAPTPSAGARITPDTTKALADRYYAEQSARLEAQRVGVTTTHAPPTPPTPDEVAGGGLAGWLERKQEPEAGAEAEAPRPLHRHVAADGEIVMADWRWPDTSTPGRDTHTDRDVGARFSKPLTGE